MAEQPQEQSDIVEATTASEENVVDTEQTTVTPEATHSADAYIIPKGAIAFGVLMILGYAFYFFMIWTEVIARGGQ